MATETTNYGLKKPAQEDFYNVEDFNGNMDIIDEALFAMQNAGVSDEAIEEIKALIGATGDTGGSTSAGSVMGKQNKTISDIAALKSLIRSYIGNTTDTGGSSTTGTVMGKLNGLYDEKDTSTPGTEKTVFSKSYSIGEWNYDNPFVIAKFIAPITGLYYFKYTAYILDCCIFKFSPITNSSFESGTSIRFNPTFDPGYIYNNVSVGTNYTQFKGFGNYTDSNIEEIMDSFISSTTDLFSGITVIAKKFTQNKLYPFFCISGEPVVIMCGTDRTFNPNASSGSGRFDNGTATVTYEG